jgi:site-specific recombinase XerD
MDSGSCAQGLISLTPDNLELQERRAIVREKAKPNRAIFISPIDVAFIQAWLAVRPTNAETIFCSLSVAYYGKALTYDGLKEISRRLKRKAGILGRVNPHRFQHGFAREYIKNGSDLATLSWLMGHADSMVTTWYYAVFTGAELTAAHDKYSPIKGLIEPEE